jgi:hypothetical protein
MLQLLRSGLWCWSVIIVWLVMLLCWCAARRARLSPQQQLWRGVLRCVIQSMRFTVREASVATVAAICHIWADNGECCVLSNVWHC